MIKLILLLLLFSTQAFSAMFAIVKAQHAVVYADTLRSAPIGKIKKGRKIRVGEKSRNKGRVLPIVVSGKIAYINVSDISLIDGSEVELPKGHDSIVGLEIRKKKFTAGFTYFNSAFEQGVYSLGAVDRKRVSVTGFNFKKEKIKKDKMDYRFGLEILSFSNEVEELFIPSVTYDWVGLLFDINRSKINFMASIGFSPYTAYKVDPFFNINGFSLHAEIGLEYIFYLAERVSLQSRLAYRYQKLSDFNLPSPFQGFAPTLTGLTLAFNVAYSY